MSFSVSVVPAALRRSTTCSPVMNPRYWRQFGGKSYGARLDLIPDIFCARAARIRAPDIAPERTGDLLGRHSDRDFVAAEDAAGFHFLVQALADERVHRVLRVGAVIAEHHDVGVGVAGLRHI